jgi:hypothetical protein
MAGSVKVWLVLAAFGAVAGCREHYRQPPERRSVPCVGLQPDRHRAMPGYPNVSLDKGTYGGTSSWTHEGDPPAGDRCTRPPSDVTPRRVAVDLR